MVTRHRRPRRTPRTLVAGFATVMLTVALAASAHTATAETTNAQGDCTIQGTICAWGGIEIVGEPTRPDRLPARLTDLTEVRAVQIAPSHGYALRADGTVWAWGKGAGGVLGNGSNDDVEEPVQVANFGSVISIAAGAKHALALRNDGTVWAWGHNLWGQLGNGQELFLPDENYVLNTPQQVVNLTNVVSIATIDPTSYALRSDGTVWAWGWAAGGLLGNGSGSQDPIYSSVPVQVSGLAGAQAIAAARNTAYALRGDGTVWAWGHNFLGELGNGSEDGASLVPTQVVDLDEVTAIAAGGGGNGYALREDGTVWAWGNDYWAQLGDGRGGLSETGNQSELHSRIPTQVQALNDVRAIGAGFANGYAIRSDGTVWAWGNNDSFELGNGPGQFGTPPEQFLGMGPTYSTGVPVVIPTLSSVAQIGGLAYGYAFAVIGEAPEPPPLKRHVVLGDSLPYGHGLANPTKDEKSGLPPNQPPSHQAYPQLVNASIPGLRPLSYRQTSCNLTDGEVRYDQLAYSGAPSMANRWTGRDVNCRYDRGTPVPLHKAVSPEEFVAAELASDPPGLVTLQVGADDIEFAACLKSLLSVPAQGGAVECVEETRNGYRLTDRAQSELNSLRTGLTAIINGIHRSSPAAQIVLLNYYQIIPEADVPLSGHTRLCQNLRLSRPGGAWRQQIRAKADFVQARLNGTIEEVSRLFPDVLLVDIANLFADHELCTNDRWIFDGIWEAAHPNVEGHRQIAQAILDRCATLPKNCVGR